MSFLLPNSITSAFKSAFADSTFRDSSQPSGGNISADLKAVYQAACISWLAIHRVQSPVRKASGQNSNQGTDAHDPQPQDEGESGDSSEIDILFYFSKELAVTREQIRRQIRVLRGATDFYLSMMTGEGQVQPQAPQNQHYRSWVIHSQKHRNIVLELGDDVWLMVSLQAPRWLRASTPKLRWQYDEEWRPDTWIVSALGSAWDTWVMLNGSATSFLRFPTSGRAELERSLEKYFSVWASRWDLQSLHNEGDQKHPFGQPQKQPRFKVFSNLLLVQHPVNPSEDLKTKRTTEKFDSTLSDIVGRRYTLSQRGTRKGNEELLREAMIFRGTCRLSCRSVAGTKPSSNDDVRILIDHVLATYGPLITPPDRGDLGHTPDGVATVTPATSNVSVKKDVRGNSSRLSFLSFWGAAEDQEQAAPTAAKVDDPAKPTKSVLTALATSAPEQTDPAPRAFPSISVTSSAWFSKSSSPQLPGPIESSDAVDNEGSPGKRPPDNTEEAKELEEEADPPEFQTFKLVAWPRRHADGTEAPLEGKRVRLLFHGECIVILVFSEPGDSTSGQVDTPSEAPETAEPNLDLRRRLKKLMCAASHSTDTSQPYSSIFANPTQGTMATEGTTAHLPKDIRDTAEGMAALHEQCMRGFPSVSELMSRSNEGHAWLRSRRSDAPILEVTHTVIPSARMSMAEAEAETSRRAVHA